MSKNNLVRIFDEKSGDEMWWRRFSDRLPQFLEKYQPDEGWRVSKRVTDAASNFPALLQLHLEAVKAGKRPSDLGLEPLPTGSIYTAELIDPNGVVVMTASSFGPTQPVNKEHEACETAAFQRLISHLGFGGSVLDADEDRTLEGMGKKIKSGTQLSVVESGSPAAASTDNQDDAEVLAGVRPIETDESTLRAATTGASEFKEAPAVAQQAEPQTPASTDAGEMAATATEIPSKSKPKHSAKSTPAAKGSTTPTRLVEAKKRQIKRLATALGVDPVAVNTDEEADAELKRLSELNAERAQRH